MAEKKKEIQEVDFVPSKELYKLVDMARYKLNVTAPESSLPEISIPDLSGNKEFSLDSLLKKKTKSEKEELKEKAAEIWKNAKIELKIKSEQIPEIALAKVTDESFTLLNKMISVFIEPFDDLIVSVLGAYNVFVRGFRSLKAKTEMTEEEKEEWKKAKKEELKNEFLKIMNTLPYVAEILSLIMLIDTIKESAKVLRDGRNASPESFDSAIETAKSTTEIINEAKDKSEIIALIVSILGIFVGLLAMIGAGYNASKEFDEAEKKANEEAKQNDKTILKPIDSLLNSEIKNWAENNENDYSYTNKILKEIEEKEIPEETDVCSATDGLNYFDMCIYDNSGYVEANYDASSAIIEINKNINTELYISENQKVNYNDKIGKVNGANLKSPISGTVTKIEENKIFIDKTNNSSDSTLIEIESIKNSANNSEKSELEEIIDKFSNLEKIERTLREYLFYCFIPKIPLNIKLNESEIDYTKDFIYEKFKDEIDKLIDNHKNEIQELNKTDNIKSYLESDRLEDFKNKLLELKRNFYENGFDIFENYLNKHSYFCKTESENYHLLSNYLELYSKIEYDTDNSYSMELNRLLTNFISVRSKLEKTDRNIQINDFNKFCEEKIGEKYEKNFDYFKYFSEKFKGNYYKEKNVIDWNGDINPEYKNMYNYLAELMNVKDNESKTIDVGDTVDINSIISTNSSNVIDVSKDKIREQLKEICRRFSIIKNINDYCELNNDINEQETDIKEELINQTKFESQKIEELYQKLKKNYLEYLNLYDGNWALELKEINPIKLKDVYYLNKKYEHYFVGKEINSKDLYENKELFDEYANTMYSPITAVPITNDEYWIKYCTQASLMSCLLPNYWSCGLMIAEAPVPLPVIYAPITYVDEGVSMLIGLGICGIFVYPLIFMLNFGLDTKTILPPINSALDEINNKQEELKKSSKNSLKMTFNKEIEKLKNENENVEEKIRQLKIALTNKKEEDIGNGLVKRRLEEKQKKAEKN